MSGEWFESGGSINVRPSCKGCCDDSSEECSLIISVQSDIREEESVRLQLRSMVSKGPWYRSGWNAFANEGMLSVDEFWKGEERIVEATKK
jgi:hypothetical protein